MEDDYGSNVHAGLEKKCPLYGVLPLECPLWRGFVITRFLRNSSGTRLKEESAIKTPKS